MNRILMILFLLLICPHPAKSQDADAASDYASTKLPDLARSYWRLNQLDTTDNKLVDQYLMITECQIYQKYFNNDFEWNKIRTATKDYIDKYRNRFPTKFEFIQPIYLDRYDFSRNGFPLMKNSKSELVSRLQIAGNELSDYPCLTSSFQEKNFPPTAALTLPKPFTYTMVKTDQVQADKFVEYLKTKNVDTRFGRPAFIQYRVKIDKSMPPLITGRQAMANFFGTIESITVYADREKTILLEDVKF